MEVRLGEATASSYLAMAAVCLGNQDKAGPSEKPGGYGYDPARGEAADALEPGNPLCRVPHGCGAEHNFQALRSGRSPTMTPRPPTRARAK